MAKTPSNMIPLGTIAPEFSLIDSISGETMQLHDLKSEKATVIMFICNHCPYVKLLQDKLIEISNKYTQLGVQFIAINSNDVETYPDDSPANMKLEAQRLGYCFPYLFDESQEVAKAYHAACTPDFYIFDGELKCAYRGRFDAATPGNNQEVTGADLSNALDCILANKPITEEQLPSVGCNIKWK